MRDLRLVSQADFNAFIAAYSPPMSNRMLDNGTIVYEDTSDGSAWPDSLVASYLVPMPPKRTRAGGWRIPV